MRESDPLARYCSGDGRGQGGWHIRMVPGGCVRGAWRRRRRHELRSDEEIMFTMEVDNPHWSVFGSAEGIPRDKKTDLERAVCVSDDPVSSQGFFKKLQFARAH